MVVDEDTFLTDDESVVWSDVIGPVHAFSAMRWRFGRRGFTEGWGALNTDILYSFFRKGTMPTDFAIGCNAPMDAINQSEVEKLLEDSDSDEGEFDDDNNLLSGK